MGNESTILLIEDEPEIRRFLRTTLPNQGYRLFEADTGQEGLAQAQARNPDLILLDLGLPDIDGLDIIKKLREWARMPIIILSARGHEQVKVTALDSGADDYITKPFGVEVLLNARLLELPGNGSPASPRLTLFSRLSKPSACSSATR